jgi:hypothetical protein
MIKHGMWKSKEWNSWDHIKRRCYNENDAKYRDYGGRGITVCGRWLDKENGFLNFFTDMGYSPSKHHTIDRKDVNGNYHKGNCKWATPKQQSRNRRNTHLLEVNGVTKSVSEWAEKTQLSVNCIKYRITSGLWGAEAIQPLILKKVDVDIDSVMLRIRNGENARKIAKSLNVKYITLYMKIRKHNSVHQH